MRTWIWIIGLVAVSLWVTVSYAEDEAPPAPGAGPGPRGGPPPGMEDGRMAGIFVAHAADKDRSRDVTAEEWKAFLDSLTSADDGTIDMEALVAALPQPRGPRGPGGKGGPPNRGAMLARAFGKEQGAALTRADFEKAFAGQDKNGDGALDADEFPQPPRRGPGGPRPGMDRRGGPDGARPQGPPPGRGEGRGEGRGRSGPQRGRDARAPRPQRGGPDGRGARRGGPPGPERRSQCETCGREAGDGPPPQRGRGHEGRQGQRGPQQRGMRGMRGGGRGGPRGAGPDGARRGPPAGGRERGARPDGPPDASDLAARIDRLTAAIEKLTELLERQHAK